MRDGSAADPCALGVAILLANLTGQGNIDHLDYAGAARDQVDFLFQIVPQTNEGAVSHRVSELQLWCVSHSRLWWLRVSNHAHVHAGRNDFIYMVPPFLAYHGVMIRNRTKIVEAYNQIKLYRNHLRDSHAGHLWRHVALGSGWIDNGYWSTG